MESTRRDPSMTVTRRLAYLALFLAYAQIVFGAVVRITDSGMGCGDHWPKCHGLWFPPLGDTELVIEITHRWIAAALLVVTLALVATAYVHREQPRIGGRGGVLRAASLAAALWLAPAILGAVTVWLELPPLVVVVHLALAMALLALLAITVMRAGGFGATTVEREGAPPRAARAAVAAAALTFVVVILGGFTGQRSRRSAGMPGIPVVQRERRYRRRSADDPRGAPAVRLPALFSRARDDDRGMEARPKRYASRHDGVDGADRRAAGGRRDSRVDAPAARGAVGPSGGGDAGVAERRRDGGAGAARTSRTSRTAR